ncbi:hypothetical protein [Xanthomonas oryzae]|uniref:hypothetical protein n=1 Tax=Xanthomonas oryzae TaxID=347 RepID=UPI0013EA4D80|nr:hypothetical protein [Xanthomonas oryzae]UXV96133.1 hypothetical protein IXO1104_00595 [Xanthomonas oryzae pv. oryzae]
MQSDRRPCRTGDTRGARATVTRQASQEAVQRLHAKGIPTLRFPHISSCEIKHLLHQGVEEGARMGHASR